MSFSAKHRTCLDLNATKIIDAIMCAKLMPCGVEERTIFCAIFAQPASCELFNQLQNLAKCKKCAGYHLR